jgi:hypothetical protein
MSMRKRISLIPLATILLLGGVMATAAKAAPTAAPAEKPKPAPEEKLPRDYQNALHNTPKLSALQKRNIIKALLRIQEKYTLKVGLVKKEFLRIKKERAKLSVDKDVEKLARNTAEEKEVRQKLSQVYREWGQERETKSFLYLRESQKAPWKALLIAGGVINYYKYRRSLTPAQRKEINTAALADCEMIYPPKGWKSYKEFKGKLSALATENVKSNQKKAPAKSEKASEAKSDASSTDAPVRKAAAVKTPPAEKPKVKNPWADLEKAATPK